MSNNKKKQQCFVQQDFPSFNVLQRCDGTTVTYFEDFTDNHNKALIQVFSTTQQSCTLTVIIDTRDGKTIERSIPVDPAFGQAERIFQVEDVCRVSFRCAGGLPTSLCTGFVQMTKTFCICCPGDEENKEKKHCGHCGWTSNCRCPRA
ncbi:hypothetical protein JSQ81_19985 [Sporosarcina sp. Marseille-Q4063]|uniref:hypothetical protein n=1 Tax=Sporosarcina sp. Marseille-Q4063 TaxID=2810514 RepID=UPI001BAED8DC|nr:hypothetical protein [Sporosarcina sp. Marseille-Q4063]QUW22015.1 hypothetical protein JSQ81_19985 [Sporosarcina sp. Marseille-Q4063]